jgi:hypothetical protein
MTGKQWCGVVCCLRALGLAIYGVQTLSNGPEITDPSGLGVSHAVGSFLPALFVLILGVWLLRKQPEE